MKNIIQNITGATLRTVSAGSNVRVIIEGAASQVAHATTLLYNYHAIGDWPAWYDSEAQESFNYMELTVTQRGFKRGILALVYSQQTERNGKHDHVNRCVRAIVRAAHLLHSLGLRMTTPLPDMSHVGMSVVGDDDDMVTA